MQGAGARYLVAIAVAAAVVSGASAHAETYRTATAKASSSPTARSSRQAWSSRDYSRVIAEASARYAVPERLIWAVIRVESGLDHRAVSRKGARGLMQLMPKTAALLGVRNAFDPRENVHAGTRHLRAMMERFPYDLHMAVAAYNAGEKAVLDFGGVPPYPETRDYVVRVLRLYATPIDCCQSQGGDIQRVADIEHVAEIRRDGEVQRFVAVDGTITYTNMPGTRLSAAR
jgi:soluble lytic murein transglycosylase-like protein